MLNSLLTVLAIGALVLVVFGALLYWRQEQFIFFPRPNDPLLFLKQQAHRVQIRTPGALLEGWSIVNEHAASPAVVIYFGGNAEDVLDTATTAPLIDARRMLLVNYRGYGRSSGKPGQRALYEDALAIHDYAIRTTGAAPEQIVVMGRSLGSSVAAMLAGARPVGGAILITPFDSLAAVAARHYSLFPVRLLLRHPFPSSEWASRATAPALILAAENDTIVPPVHAQQLHDAWAGDKRLRVLEDVGHNDIEQHPDYYTLINEFLRKL